MAPVKMGQMALKEGVRIAQYAQQFDLHIKVTDNDPDIQASASLEIISITK